MQGWCARRNGFQQQQSRDIQSLKSQLKEKQLSRLTLGRLKSQLSAKQQYLQQIESHLQPMVHFSRDFYPQSNALIAKNQGVDSYINNLFRDWAWDNGENEEMLSAIEDIVPQSFNAGAVITLGAGGSRLSYDFHHQYFAAHSVLLDINPVLLGAAGKIIAGGKFSLYEFPVAPLGKNNFSIRHQCKLPEKTGKTDLNNFTFILGDVLNVPFKKGTFDTVLTPWLIDIIPVDFKQFIPHVSRLLKPGGLWLNIGSLAFFHQQANWHYSDEEVIDLLKKFGFEVILHCRREINYLRSPHSANGRIENLFCFSARKKFATVSAKPHQYLPKWIQSTTKAIPVQEQLIVSSSRYLLQAQVLSAIDGNRSIVDIGRMVAQQYKMSEQSAYEAVRQILIENQQADFP